MTAEARITEGGSPVYYTTGADRSGVYRNAMVLWSFNGPGEATTHADGHVTPRESQDPASAMIEVQFSVEQPGTYRLRVATTDLTGRSAVTWKDFKAAN